MTTTTTDPHDVPCPTCSAPAHVACTRHGRFTEHPHDARCAAILDAAGLTILADVFRDRGAA